MGSSPALDQNFFVQVFFGFVRLFSQIFLMSPKGPPFIFFLFCIRMDVQNLPKGPLLQFFGTMRLTGDQKISKKNFKKNRIFLSFPHAGTVEENTSHFEVLLLFLSLRYGADLGRSRLVYH